MHKRGVPISVTLTFLLIFSAPAEQKSRSGEAVSITHGPILGRLGHHQVGVWARTSQPGTFQVRYGVEPNKLDQLSSPATTRLERDNTGWVLLQGLKSDTKYFYQLAADGLADGPGGSFRTLPDPDDYRHPELNPRGLYNFRFEFGVRQ